jgi:hypothetical protein
VRKNAATVVSKLCEKNPNISERVWKTGGIPYLCEMVHSSKGTVRLPAILGLKNIADHNENLAKAVLDCGVASDLVQVVMNEP